MKATKFARIAFFTIFTLAWSYVYFILRPFDGLENTLTYPVYILTGLFPALGLMIASSFFRIKLSQKPKATFLGNNKKYSLIMASIPVGCLMFFGVPNSFGIQEHAFGLYLGLVVIVYAVFEEYGWRGYLQEELSDRLKWMKFAIIATVWYAWHWSFMDYPFEILKIGSQWLMFFGASAAIGMAVKETKSILVGAAFHALGNIVLMYSLVANSISLDAKIILGIVFILVWKHLSKKWDEQEGGFMPELV